MRNAYRAAGERLRRNSPFSAAGLVGAVSLSVLMERAWEDAMSEVVRLEAADGSFMLVEVSRPVAVLQRSEVEEIADDGERIRRAATALEDSLASVGGAAAALMATVSQLEPSRSGLGLDEVSLELSLSLGVEGGVIVAKGSLEAQASVTLTWKARPTG